MRTLERDNIFIAWARQTAKKRKRVYMLIYDNRYGYKLLEYKLPYSQDRSVLDRLVKIVNP